jgi:hypothetical protein
MESLRDNIDGHATLPKSVLGAKFDNRIEKKSRCRLILHVTNI